MDTITRAPDFDALSAAAQEVMMQMFLNGPTWDGHVMSKAARDELRRAELIERWNGWQWLNAKGVAMAIDQGTISRVKRWHDQRWYKKAIS